MLLRAEFTTPSSLRRRRQINAFPAIGVTTGMKKMIRSTRENLLGRCCSQYEIPVEMMRLAPVYRRANTTVFLRMV